MLEMLKKLLMEGLVSPIVWAMVVGIIMAIIHALAKSRAALVDAIIAKAVDVGYDALSKVAPLTPTTLDDQAVVFLKAFRDYFVAHGLIVTPKIETKALAMFREMSGKPEVK